MNVKMYPVFLKRLTSKLFVPIVYKSEENSAIKRAPSGTTFNATQIIVCYN